jgi:glutathione reductase (NADPH)
MTDEFDLLVLGAGSAGVRLARMAASVGHRVAVVEQRHLGGTCVNVGCVPKKLFVYAAEYREAFAQAAGFGWQTGVDIGFDWMTLRRNKDAEIRRLNGVYESLLKNAGVTIIDGHASFIERQAVAVGARTLRANRIVVATGGRPFVPDIPGAELAGSSDDLFFLERLPDTATVVGGGYIAVEMAGILNGLGVDTTLIHRRDTLLAGFDSEVGAFVQAAIAQRGVRLCLGETVAAVSGRPGALQVQLGSSRRLEAGLVLMATGRVPNTEGLNLARADVATSTSGAIVVDDQYRTSNPHVFALGDVTGRVQLTPVAIAEAMYLARAEFGLAGPIVPVDYGLIPTAVFSQPCVATVGMSEDQARAAGRDIAVFATSFRPMKNVMSGGTEKCLIKVIVDRRDDRVLGAHMVGDAAGEIIQGIAVAMSAGLTKAQLDRTIGIHPTVAEEFVTLRQARS